MMKKLILGILIILFIFGCQVQKEDSDALKFVNEYQALNNENNPNNDKKYSELKIEIDNPIVYADYEKIFNILENTGIIYFGFPECPWCRVAVPVLLEAAKEAKIPIIYYLNNKEDRDNKTLEGSKVVVNKNGTEDYYKLLQKLGDKASEYSGLQDKNIKRLYFPSVIFVKNGKIIHNQVGTVDSHKDPYEPLSDKQYKELKEIYLNNMNVIFNNVCNNNSEC